MTTKSYQELVPNRIFIGGVNDIEDLLKHEKIDVIYDIRAEVNGPLPSEKSVHQPIVDEADNQDASIKAAVDQVMQSYENGKNVFFHCNTGRGRAGTVAAAVLLELGQAKTVDEAEQLAQEIRPQVSIRKPFKEALTRLYEQ